jgi:transposase
MIDRLKVFEIHRLIHEGYSQREVAAKLGISRITVAEYIEKPDRTIQAAKRDSIIDSYKETINEFLDKEPDVKAPVVLQRLAAKGFTGKISLVRSYLAQQRGQRRSREPFIRFESAPGQQMQLDWGHCDSLTYGNTQRKLYVLAITECFSRQLYMEFTHSVKQAVLHQAMLNAFQFFGGTPNELVVDNMLTAVIDRQGSLIQFNDAFLDFLRPFHIRPIACNVRKCNEKGKVERVIGYIRTNFWPLREISNLCDAQQQANEWRDTIANTRIHQTTGEQPVKRFARVKLNPLLAALPDCREMMEVKVHKDFSVRFDGNTYTVPPWAIGKRVTLKADARTVTIYLKEKKIAAHSRSFDRFKRIENAEHVEKVKKIKKRLWADKDLAELAGIGRELREYMEKIADANQPIRKTVAKLLALKGKYGALALIAATRKALNFNAIGVEYIENILHREATPMPEYPKINIKDEALKRIKLAEPSLEDYDALILKRIAQNKKMSESRNERNAK